MDIDRMREYVKLCETLNFTRTAKELFISQSTLSKHIAQTEDEVGAPLILRSTHDAELTKEGELVRERFERMLDDYDSLLGEVAELRDGVTGSLRVGFIYYGGMSYMREGLDRFYANYPNVRVDFVSQQPHDTIAGLRSGELDAGLIYEVPALEDEFEFVPVHDCKVYAFVSDGDELASHTQIMPCDLAGRSMLLLDADPEYNDTVERLLAEAQVAAGPHARCGQVDEFPRFVTGSDAVFLSTGHMPHYPGDGMAMVPINDAAFVFRVGLYYRRSQAGFLVSSFVNSWL